MDQFEQKRYLDGMRRYKNRGVRILIDNEEKPEAAWGIIFAAAAEGCYYRTHFVHTANDGIAEIRFERQKESEIRD